MLFILGKKHWRRGIDVLEKQTAIFGNPQHIITDRNIFKDYCVGKGPSGQRGSRAKAPNRSTDDFYDVPETEMGFYPEKTQMWEKIRK